jgi:signal transduction histidine kinase
MKLTIAKDGSGWRDASGEETSRLLGSRLHTGLWISLVSIAVFSFVDLHVQPEHVPSLAPLRILQAVIVVATIWALSRPRVRAHVTSVGILAVAAFYSTTAMAGIVARDVTTTPLLGAVFAMTTATLLPWGARFQLVSAAIAAVAMLVNVVIVSGDPAAIVGYPGVGVAVALICSVFVAYEQERHRLVRERMALLVAGQTRVLETIAEGEPLADILSGLSIMIEQLTPGLLCSVLLLDGDRLRHGAAPSLPEEYNRAIDGIVIGPEVGSCGRAAALRTPVVVADIASDPLWRDFRDLALGHGLRACWSAPIMARDGHCLGTFAMYYRQPRSPGRQDWHRIQTATHLARVAIERRRTESALNASTRRLEEESQISGTLVRVGREMMGSLSTPAVLERLCRVTTELLACDCSDTLLRDPHENVYVPRSAYGYSQAQCDALGLLRIPAGVFVDLVAGLERESLVQVRTASVDSPAAVKLLEDYGITISMYVALKRGDQVIGILSAAYRGRHELFTPVQQRIALGIAQWASMALENARLIEELRHANQLKSEFVSTMSHELRTPLNVIMGYSEMLQEGIAPLEQENALTKIRSSSLELLEMIEATLNLNRLEGGKDPPYIEAVSLPTLLDELASEFAALPRRAETVLRWIPAAATEIRTDRRKLKIILKNLVGNALKFTAAGEVAVCCEVSSGRCAFSVADTGVGIAPEHLPVIFEMFRQGDSSDARSYSGVGLGLYIVRRLVTQLGGDVHVETALGRGSTFTVTLPVAEDAPALRATA